MYFFQSIFRYQITLFSIWRLSQNIVKTDTKHTFSFFALPERRKTCSENCLKCHYGKRSSKRPQIGPKMTAKLTIIPSKCCQKLKKMARTTVFEGRFFDVFLGRQKRPSRGGRGSPRGVLSGVLALPESMTKVMLTRNLIE